MAKNIKKAVVREIVWMNQLDHDVGRLKELKSLTLRVMANDGFDSRVIQSETLQLK